MISLLRVTRMTRAAPSMWPGRVECCTYMYVLGVFVRETCLCWLAVLESLFVKTFLLRCNSGPVLDTTKLPNITPCGGSTSSRNETVENDTPSETN